MTKLKKWMMNNVADYIDPLTGDINCTQLAEDCALHFYDRNAEDDEFDLAQDVAELYEKED